MQRSTLVVLALAAAGTASALAQEREAVQGDLWDRFNRQQRLVDDQLDRVRSEEAPLESLVDLQWGAWLEYYMFHYDDGVQSSRFVQRPALAVWSRLRLDDGAHEIFARMRLRWTGFRTGDEIDRVSDWWGPNFDQLWYQIDVGKAFRLTKPSDPLQLRARVGRQTVVFGTGYALDLPMDAVLVEGQAFDFRVQGLFGKSFRSYPNIDQSEPVDSRSDRCFMGLQVLYDGWQRHAPFAYIFWNNDSTTEDPEDLFQNYAYDSLYVGLGSRGELAHNLNYWAEGVLEFGKSFGDGAVFRQDSVQAWAWDIGIEKLFDVPTHPRIAGEYMFASGDPDRVYSPTNARGGNRSGTLDTSFVAFGFRDTGIALAPVLSNLHIWRLGGAFAPLDQHEFFRDLELGTNFFLYHKNSSHGAISDPLADNFDGYVGWEMDYFINWRFASDLSWTIRWGTFFPGSAYSDRECRHFLFTGLTWSI